MIPQGYEITGDMVPRVRNILGVPDRRDSGTRRGMLNKTLERSWRGRVPPVPYLRDSRAIVTRPARRKGLQLLSSFLYYFFCRLWTDLAWELKLEGLSALFSYF